MITNVYLLKNEAAFRCQLRLESINGRSIAPKLFIDPLMVASAADLPHDLTHIHKS